MAALASLVALALLAALDALLGARTPPFAVAVAAHAAVALASLAALDASLSARTLPFSMAVAAYAAAALRSANARRPLQWWWQPLRLQRLLRLLRSMPCLAHARRPFVTAALASLAALALLAALDVSLGASTPPFESATAAHAAVVLASLAALNASLCARKSPLLMAVAAHAAVALRSANARRLLQWWWQPMVAVAALASLAVLDASLGALTPPLCDGGGSSCGQSACFACSFHALLCVRTPPSAIPVSHSIVRADDDCPRLD